MTFVYFDYDEELADYCLEHLEEQYGFGEMPNAPNHIRLDVQGMRYVFGKAREGTVHTRRSGTKTDFYNLMLIQDFSLRKYYMENNVPIMSVKYGDIHVRPINKIASLK